MKMQLKTVLFFSIALVCISSCIICLGSRNEIIQSENSSEFKYEHQSSPNVDEMIEKVKAPTYYTVFNVIINYLPLKN